MKTTNICSHKRSRLTLGQRTPGLSALCRIMLATVLAIGIFSNTVQGSDPFTLTITATNLTGYQIPNDFSGLSWGLGQGALQGINGVSGQPFDPTNLEFLTLWQQMDLRNLRLGWGLGDPTNLASLLQDWEIDKVFGFAQQAGLKVIFSLQQNTPTDNVNTDSIFAQYVWTNYQATVDYFAIGNEPDANPNFTNYTQFLSSWNSFYGTISAAVPGAPFLGPDVIYNTWAGQFANSEHGSGRVSLITQHEYWGGSPQGQTSDTAVSNMLSEMWVNSFYTNAYNSLSSVRSDGYPYRFTEMNDYLGGVAGASDAFASALWALDVMHWWALNGAAGINFHNNEWLLTDTIYLDRSKHYQPNPKAMGIKAWDLGGHGHVMPMTVSNPNGANVTTYAVGAGQDLYLTIINKHAVQNGSIAACTIVPNGYLSASVRAMYLKSTSGNLEATNDTLLGGAYITNNAQWQGLWTDLTPDTNGQVVINVSPAQAAVVHLHAGCAYVGPIQINNNGTVEMFANSNGVVYHDWQKTQGILGSSLTNWVGWNNIGAIGGGVSAVGGPAVIKNLDGALEVLVSGSDGNVYNNYQLGPSGSWSGWFNMGGPGATNLQVALNADGSLIVFGIGTNGDVWYDSETSSSLGAGETGWTDLSGQQVQAGYEVAQNLNGCVEIFGVDTNGTVWHDWENNLWGTWHGWASLTGAAVNPRIQVGRDSYGRLSVFGVDTTSGGIDFISQGAPSGSWGSWDTSTLGAPSGVTVQPGFVPGVDGNGRFEIVAVGSDGNVYHKWLNANNTWSGWNSLGGSGTNPQLAVCNLLNGALQVFGIDTANNDVWSIWQLTPAGNWSSWTDFGGTGLIFYPGQP